ncbi:hypothetical protein SH203_01920 [Brevundimonas sp. SH203]|uniref:hypothetical protein n=1 Tax=Brevundimonas sp. SH203 TaxID=345167 RepID=UPI0009CDCC1C|nr:hypothetical protein [Brevundimonas sp. SH203]GAW41512.1 hypothetical protein SH203_01920 [Brevundimonas sp. SH203]
MLLEFGLEPKVVGADWRQCKYLLEKFGFDRGRLIAAFPKQWQRAVHEAAADLSDMDRKRVETLLARAKSALVRSGRNYDPELEWFANAVAQQAVSPFHAIIADQNSDGRDDVLVAADVDEEVPLFQSSHGWQVQRTGAALAEAMGPLLSYSREIWFVDPFFSVLELPYVETLRTCLAAVAASGNVGAKLQIHYRENDRRPPTDELERRIPRSLAGVIPAGMSISLHAWAERDAGEDMHARYLLTDRGGLSVEAGFSAVGPHQNVDLHLLTPQVCEAKRRAFADGAAYKQEGPVLIIGSDCQVTRR